MRSSPPSFKGLVFPKLFLFLRIVRSFRGEGLVALYMVRIVSSKRRRRKEGAHSLLFSNEGEGGGNLY